MNVIFKIVAAKIQNKEIPFETEFDIIDMKPHLQEELKEELLYKALGLEKPKEFEDASEDYDSEPEPQRRGPGRPRKTA